jgi:TRAP-type mannitol/chloroaromatic compound transport system substrate-binding protein
MKDRKPVDRRNFVRKASGIAAGAVAIGACAGSGDSAPAVQTSPRVRWRLASAFPRSLETLFGINDYVAGRVEAITDGRFTIRAYPAGEIVPPLQVLDAAQQGTVQLGHAASYYFIGKNPALAFDAGVPFGLTARQQHSWLYEGGGSALVNELFADFNVIAFPAGSTGTQMGGWFRNEIGGLDDLGGLKMRIPGLGGEVMSRLGVSVQVLAGGEIYQALERGAIDATEWVGPYDDEKLGFQNVANHYYYPGWWETGPTLSFYANRDAFDSLPGTYQEVLRSVMIEAAQIMTARYDALNPPALARLIESGVQLHPFSQDIMAAAHRTSFELYEEQAAADAGYRRVYEAWKAFREVAYAWSGTAEHEYARFAYEQAGR